MAREVATEAANATAAAVAERLCKDAEDRMQTRLNEVEALAKSLAGGSGASSASTTAGPGTDAWANYRPFAAPAPPSSVELK
eukprot:3271529-Lingulodinium_polyedra.AAC.1